MNDGYTTTHSAKDIATVQNVAEFEFWEQAYLAALHRVDAGKASTEASLALLHWREMGTTVVQSAMGALVAEVLGQPGGPPR